jgi:hypothetical protein
MTTRNEEGVNAAKMAVKEERRRVRQALESSWRDGMTKTELLNALFPFSTPPAPAEKQKWVDLSRENV